jgi:hypothetical protein
MFLSFQVPPLPKLHTKASPLRSCPHNFEQTFRSGSCCMHLNKLSSFSYFVFLFSFTNLLKSSHLLLLYFPPTTIIWNRDATRERWVEHLAASNRVADFWQWTKKLKPAFVKICTSWYYSPSFLSFTHDSLVYALRTIRTSKLSILVWIWYGSRSVSSKKLFESVHWFSRFQQYRKFRTLCTKTVITLARKFQITPNFHHCKLDSKSFNSCVIQPWTLTNYPPN